MALGWTALSPLAALVVTGATAAATASGATTSTPATITPGPAQAVPGVILLGVACGSPTPTTCLAVGVSSSAQYVGAVVVITDGRPGAVRLVKTNGLSSVACVPVTTTCMAVGRTSPNNVVMPITDGIPGPPIVVPGTNQLTAVACTTSTTCVAVGESTSGLGEWVPVTNGVPGVPHVVQGTFGFGGVACANPTTCVAVGNNSTPRGDQGLAVTIHTGVAAAPQVDSGTRSLDGVACPGVTACVAVGSNTPTHGTTYGLVVTIANGIPAAPQPVSGVNVLDRVACLSATTCLAVGKAPTGAGVVVPITDGVAGAPQVVAETSWFNDINCPTAVSCVAVGVASAQSFPSDPLPAVVVQFTAASPAPAKANQTIVFTSAPPDGAVVGAAYRLAAEGGQSHNPVTFSVDASSTGICTVSGVTVVLVAPGGCVIDANQAGDSSYLPAPPARVVVTVSKPQMPPQPQPPARPAHLAITGRATMAACALAILLLVSGAVLVCGWDDETRPAVPRSDWS